MLKNFIYICGDDRSGSTLLELLLGSHPDIWPSGELHNIPAYYHNTRLFFNPSYELKCTCGASIKDCDFWQEVERNLGTGSLGKLLLREDFLGNTSGRLFISSIYRKLRFSYKKTRPSFFRFKLLQRILGYGYVARDYFNLYQAISKVSGAPIITDSSKWPYRISYLYNFYPDLLKVVLLLRDPRGVVWSKHKRGMDVATASKMWKRVFDDMFLFSKDIPPENKILVTYEDLCQHPEHELNRIYKMLNVPLPGSPAVLCKEGIHHIGGSPSKFDTRNTTIKYDSTYRHCLSQEQLKVVQEICEFERLSNHAA